MEENNKENTPEVKYIDTEEDKEQEVVDKKPEKDKKENKSNFDAALLAGILGAILILGLIIFFVLVY